MTKVHDNAIGQSAINHLRRYGVDTQFIARGGGRLGIYFLESGASMRASQVIYDRAGASIAEAEISDFDFDKIFEGADWFHTTGITPALSDKCSFLAESTLRESYSASDNGWSALVYDGKEFYRSRQYEVRIVDRVGSGDSFASGFIYGLVTGMNMKDAAEFGVAASALKHTIPGDLNHATLSEVKDLMKGDASGRVQR